MAFLFLGVWRQSFDIVHHLHVKPIGDMAATLLPASPLLGKGGLGPLTNGCQFPLSHGHENVEHELTQGVLVSMLSETLIKLDGHLAEPPK